jgi:RimJ/RimL family protein N-acetyltransferase
MQARGRGLSTSMLQQETPIMSSACYSAQEHLRDGRLVKVRALQPDDETSMLVAIDRTGTESLKRRFFAPKRWFSDAETAFFMNVDFVDHAALVAEIDEDGKTAIIGGGRYVVVEPGQAEIAFIVVDAYQRQRLGTILVRHIVGLARAAGLERLSADVLPENVVMLNVLGKFGFQIHSMDSQVAHLTLALV